jgi:hypothetical protein
MPITTPPTAPSRSRRSTFDIEGDAWNSWQEQHLVPEINALEDNVITQASMAVTAAETAVGAANAALAAVNATKWVSGDTYADGAVVWSPSDYMTYRRRGPGSGTIDPSVDPVNWSMLIIREGRNKIINGNMMIHQRRGGGQQSNVTDSIAYIVDRFYLQTSSGATFLVAQYPGGGGEHTRSAYCRVTSAGTPNFAFIQQNIEGYNVAELKLGTASSRPFTISFWVKSSVIGTYSVSLQSGGYDYSYNATYTVNAANTWEYKTLTITAPTSGTWYNDTRTGLVIRFCLTTSAGTAGEWVSGSQNGTPDCVNFCGTQSATFQITGVQLEVGSASSVFEHRPYSTELALCQRYYWTGTYYGSGYGDVTNKVTCAINTPVTMRVQPAVLNDSDESGIVADGVLYNLISNSASILNGWWNGNNGLIHFSTNDQMPRWTTAYVRINNLQLSAEM